MARTDVRMHGLSFLLNRWPEVMHEVLYRFNQISGEGIRQEANCQNHVYIQYERDYIAQALMNATTQARQYLGYPPAPMWIEDEVVTVKSDLSWNQQTLSTKFDYVQAFGRRAATLIAPNVGVTYSRTRDTVPLDMATLDAVSGVTGIPADEIQVFFRVEDGAAAGGHECWQIEPLTVEVSGDNAAISGGRWLFVHPANVWATEYVQSDGVWPKFEGDVENEDLFITAVDVYRVYADPTNAVELILDPAQTTDSPVFSTADLVDADRGHYKLLTGSGQEDPTGAVRKASVSYKAGFPLTDGHMDAQFEQAIVRYANVLMPQAPEMCGRPAAMWQADQDMPEPSAQDAWYTPAFGLSVGGLHLAGVVEARQSKLKGKGFDPIVPEFNIVSEVRKRIVATDAAFASELKTELDLPANRLTNQHRQVVRSWRVKPTFAYKITLAGSKVTVTVFARGQYRWHYIWTDKGTKKHTITAKTGKVLSFKTGYRARTKPIARYGVGSGQANGKRVFAQTVKHPGTAARKFSETFGKKIAPDIRKAMDNAFKRAIRKGRG